MLRNRLKNRLKRLVGRDAPASAPPRAAPAPRPAPVVTAPEPVVEEPLVVEEPEPEPVVVEEPAVAAPPKKKKSFAALAAAAAAGELDDARHADQASTDVEAYAERARVNGRSVELAGAGLNVADDGVEFIGPVDNESSRAKAAGEVLSIDQDECISCGTCVEQTADVFFLGEDDKSGEEIKAEVMKQVGPMDLIQDAIDACPVTCINWLGSDELDERHSAGGVD